jgi:hypothetical protein
MRRCHLPLDPLLLKTHRASLQVGGIANSCIGHRLICNTCLSAIRQPAAVLLRTLQVETAQHHEQASGDKQCLISFQFQLADAVTARGYVSVI